MSYVDLKRSHTPWVEKYRPRQLSDVASQDHAVKVLKKNLELANLPHMLFYGPPGTGKTSTILALARQLYGPRLFKSRVLELNASDERGIAIVRSKIKTFARLAVSNPTPEDADYPCPPYKIIILDEADSMTNDAQAALRRTMENYAGVTRFCLVCNYVTRIIDPLALRCSKFQFRPLDNADALARLKFVAKNEEVNASEDVLLEVMAVSGGDLRRAITCLQLAARLSAKSAILKDLIREITGVVGEELMDSYVAVLEHPDSIEAMVRTLVVQGWSAQQVVAQLHDKFILNDQVSSAAKSKIAALLFLTDKRLASGTDEHIQLLALLYKLSEALEVK